MRLALPKTEAVDLSQRTRWYVFVRLLFLLAIAVPGILSLYTFQGWSAQVQSDSSLAALAIASNLVFYILTRLSKNNLYQIYLAIIWILLDILLISFLIFTKGGIESRSPILYTIPILVSAAIFGRRTAYISASLCSVLYATLIIFDYSGIIHSSGAFDPTLRTNLPYVINTICFFPAIFLVIAIAIDFITQLLVEKQRQATISTRAMLRAQRIAKLGSWEWHTATNDIIWSDELYRIYEIDSLSTQLRYETYIGMTHPDDIERHKKTIRSAFKKKVDFKLDHRIMTPGGTVKYLHIEGRPVLNHDGSMRKMIGTSQDVTESYYLNIAKQEFVSLASHQLRTPASGVKAFLSLMLDGYAGPLQRNQKEFLKKAYDANNRQLDIIDSLLNLASIESGKMTLRKKDVDVNELVKQAVAVYRPKLKEKQQILVINKSLPRITISADPSNLQMAIDNLLSNANKYTPEKGTITLTTRSTNKTAYIDIEDTGIGVAKKDAHALFQKFSRIENPLSKDVNGSGLGLYLAQYIVQLHGGKITVQSSPGKGAKFTIKLPLLKPEGVK